MTWRTASGLRRAASRPRMPPALHPITDTGRPVAVGELLQPRGHAVEDRRRRARGSGRASSRGSSTRARGARPAAGSCTRRSHRTAAAPAPSDRRRASARAATATTRRRARARARPAPRVRAARTTVRREPRGGVVDARHCRRAYRLDRRSLRVRWRRCCTSTTPRRRRCTRCSTRCRRARPIRRSKASTS